MLSYFLAKVCRYRSGVCIQNLSRSFPNYSYKEIYACAEAFYQNLARILWETIFPSITKLEVRPSAQRKIEELGKRHRPLYFYWDIMEIGKCSTNFHDTQLFL